MPNTLTSDAMSEPTAGLSTGAGVTIRAMQPGDDGTAFRTLNEEWITRFFKLEAKDREVLNEPEEMILRKGGQVYFAVAEGREIACCALVPAPEGSYELSKMAVLPEMRGLGIGRRLLEHTIGEARRMGARSLYLGSNSILRNAVHLYESLGFQHVAAERIPTLYARADVFMYLDLRAAAAVDGGLAGAEGDGCSKVD